MKNKVVINTLPIVLSAKQKKSPDKNFIFSIAKQNLELAQMSIKREIEQNIPVIFSDEIILSISINTKTFKIKIDYSGIKSKKSMRLIKLYLSDDEEAFIEEWFKI